jgi:hypothetical protein
MRHKKPQPAPDWQTFERLVAGLHATDPRATVTWDEDIDGRQFDVTIRFPFLDYTYLTVIECKDQRVKPEHVDALVTKARDAKANKAIIVSSKTPTRGAKNVAQRHGIDLYTLTQLNDLPEWVIVQAIRPIISITDITATTADTTTYDFPTRNNELTYALTHSILTSANGRQTADDLIQAHRDTWEPTLTPEKPRTITLHCDRETTLSVPYEDSLTITTITFTATLTTGKEVDTGGLDINVLTPTYEYQDALTGTTRTVTNASIAHGFDTKITAGEFYEDPSTNVRFYIQAIDQDGWATIHQLESYQHGELFQLTMRQRLEPPYYALPVTDERTRKRLQRMLTEMQARPATATGTVRAGQLDDACPCNSGKTVRHCHGRHAGNRPMMIFKTTKAP